MQRSGGHEEERDISLSLIERYGLAPHPEGGHYRRVHRAAQTLWSDAAQASRPAVTHIYFLLRRGEISRFHRVLHDELWHVYEGAPLRLLQFDGERVREEVIGAGGKDYFGVVPGGCHQAAESTGEYTLAGCTVAPGFDFADFSFLCDELCDEPGLADAFAAQHMALRRFL